MFKSTDEIKQFILWCKEEKVQQFQIGEVAVVLSNLALVESELGTSGAGEERNSSKTYSDDADADSAEMSKKEQDDLLFHSSGF